MNRQRLLRSLTCLAVITIGQASSTLHAQDACGAVFDALTKVVTTPNHSYSTRITNGKPLISERIYTQSKAFIRVNGKWTTIREDTTEILQQEADNRKHGTATCRAVREESVDGQRATVYSLHSKTEYATEDAQMWIAKGTGLPLREEMDVDVGAGKLGKSHLSTRYEYSNIQPPM
jgi:hypothetical protein